MDEVAKTETEDTPPTWGSMWQLTLADFQPEAGPLAAVGVFECEAPVGGAIMDVHCVGTRLFITLGIVEGEETGPKDVRKIQVWAASDRFTVQETGRYVGAFVWREHVFYAFDNTDSVIKEEIAKAKFTSILRSRLSEGLVTT